MSTKALMTLAVVGAGLGWWLWARREEIAGRQTLQGPWKYGFPADHPHRPDNR